MKVLRFVVILVVLVATAAGAFLLWARSAAEARFARTWQIEPHPVPVPWPLTEEEIAKIEANRAATPMPGGPDSQPVRPKISRDQLQKVALARAVARGRNLVDTRLACRACHGSDLGGAVVMDAAPVGRLAGPNITQGAGSVVKDFTTTDWERIIRHGVNQRGLTSSMPAIDYEGLSDREVSDIIAYVQSYPPIDRELAPSHLGPVLWVNYALGAIAPAAERIDHARERPKVPPAASASTEYGAHISKVCRGCHRLDYRGGKIAEGDPAWPPASNLTPHETGLKGWTKAQFIKAMREGVRPDGRVLDAKAMPWPAFGQMGDMELEAMYVYFMSLEAKRTGS